MDPHTHSLLESLSGHVAWPPGLCGLEARGGLWALEAEGRATLGDNARTRFDVCRCFNESMVPLVRLLKDVEEVCTRNARRKVDRRVMQHTNQTHIRQWYAHSTML